jgi:flavin reductase (DIM6/NTAB) family NADH-FMN oxidoreductase RutF
MDGVNDDRAATKNDADVSPFAVPFGSWGYSEDICDTALVSPDDTAAKVDVPLLRRTLGKFVTGVTVVTTIDPEGMPRGFTANSFASVSLDPPLVLVCVAKSATSYRIFEWATGYAVNILADDQRHISKQFASKHASKFDDVQWNPGSAGNPLIRGAAAWFDCRIYNRVLAGDHLILIGRVNGFSSTSANPLAYCQGAYASLIPEGSSEP